MRGQKKERKASGFQYFVAVSTRTNSSKTKQFWPILGVVAPPCNGFTGIGGGAKFRSTGVFGPFEGVETTESGRCCPGKVLSESQFEPLSPRYYPIPVLAYSEPKVGFGVGKTAQN